MVAQARTTEEAGGRVVAISWLLLSSGLVAFLPITAKLAYLGGSEPYTLLALRSVIAVALLGLALLIARRVPRLPRRLLPTSFLAGAGAAGFLYGFYNAIVTIDIGLAMLITYLYPILLASIEHATGRTPFTSFRLFWSLAALTGLGIMLAADLTNLDPAGLAFAFFGMLSITVATLAGMRLVWDIGVLEANFHATLWSVPLFLSALFLFGSVQLPQTGIGWLGVLGNAIAATTAWICFILGAKIIGTGRAAMITTVEPLFAVLMASLFFGEHLAPLQWFGLALVLLALAALESPKRWRERSRHKTS
ncbi:MAG: DMT family transporter [Kiloniellales bacterium]